MQNLKNYKEKLYKIFDEIIKENTPKAVMLSGGMDSSSIAFLSKKYNKGLESITVVSENTESPDLEYAKLVSKKLLIKKQNIAVLKESEISDLIEKVVLSLECFNFYWISAALVLFKGLMVAKNAGINNIATGEGSDDLFGSFPLMLNWQYGDSKLKEFIMIRMRDIDVMTKKISKYLDIEINTPFHDKKMIDFILNLPMNLRIKVDKNKTEVTKYLLRETFKDLLPELVVNRPQMMAFSGASTLDLLFNKYKDLIDVDKFRKTYNINFTNSFECYLFDILNKAGKYRPINDKNACLYCHSKLRAENSVHCTICGTSQYNKKILSF